MKSSFATPKIKGHPLRLFLTETVQPNDFRWADELQPAGFRSGFAESHIKGLRRIRATSL